MSIPVSGQGYLPPRTAHRQLISVQFIATGDTHFSYAHFAHPLPLLFVLPYLSSTTP